MERTEEMDMEQDREVRTGQEKAETGRSTEQKTADDCRCKEASTLSPRELLKLMLSDLAFWKKEKER